MIGTVMMVYSAWAGSLLRTVETEVYICLGHCVLGMCLGPCTLHAYVFHTDSEAA